MIGEQKTIHTRRGHKEKNQNRVKIIFITQQISITSHNSIIGAHPTRGKPKKKRLKSKKKLTKNKTLKTENLLLQTGLFIILAILFEFVLRDLRTSRNTLN